MPGTTKIRGATAEQRQAARQKRARERLANQYVQLMRAATSPRHRLAHACAYLRAVANGMTADEVDRLAHTITRMAEEENGRDRSK